VFPDSNISTLAGVAVEPTCPSLAALGSSGGLCVGGGTLRRGLGMLILKNPHGEPLEDFASEITKEMQQPKSTRKQRAREGALARK
jgi:hypothetical protein